MRGNRHRRRSPRTLVDAGGTWVASAHDRASSRARVELGNARRRLHRGAGSCDRRRDDDDDHLRPDTIASLLELAREQRAEVVYGGFEEHRPNGTSSVGTGFPPRRGCFSWAGALVHGGLRFFERELVAADLEMPGDMYLLERMLRVGVRFALLDEVVLDYFPSTLWEP
jgi:hypothetical protein